MNHRLVIREIDRKFFQAIKDGDKTIETRAATEKYKKIKTGDFLIFVCGQEKFEREVKEVLYFESIEKMFEELDFKKVIPFLDSPSEAASVYFAFPGYEEKIKKFGLVAFKLL